ncbi:hypothetical protein M0811_09024 [Anaeramoeba ignava]|uniref:Uncharacterized protein n=1 Tax=Anaeramoeba ignava TaxID=1746090 RepID=A0A9Q0LIJ9_ANAIG|nr:hypothetical protein M0811_09024 [Anaeramoeba ignava]
MSREIKYRGTYEHFVDIRDILNENIEGIKVFGKKGYTDQFDIYVCDVQTSEPQVLLFSKDTEYRFPTQEEALSLVKKHFKLD